MPLRLEIISHQRVRLGERRLKEFGIKGGTIGRSLENDWALEDANRYLSARHAAVDFRSGSYYIVDMSTNGVYVNDNQTPIGRTKPQRLFDGDRLRFGEYVMQVHIDETGSDEEDGGQVHIDPVARAQRAEIADATDPELLSEAELGAPAVDDILEGETVMMTLSADAEQALAAQAISEQASGITPPWRPRGRAPADRGGSVPSEPPRGTPKPRPKPRGPAVAAGGTAERTAFYAFLRGAGLAPRELGLQQAALVLHRAGQLLRELTVGLRRSIDVRVDQKNALSLADTTIRPRQENALKSSASVEAVLESLLFTHKPGYLPPLDAVRESFEDITTHERALLGAMHAALLDYLKNLDPEEIRRGGAAAGKRSLLGGKAEKLWARYAELYTALAKHAPGHFPQAFARLLASAYERERASIADSVKPPRRADNRFG